MDRVRNPLRRITKNLYLGFKRTTDQPNKRHHHDKGHDQQGGNRQPIPYTITALLVGTCFNNGCADYWLTCQLIYGTHSCTSLLFAWMLVVNATAHIFKDEK